MRRSVRIQRPPFHSNRARVTHACCEHLCRDHQACAGGVQNSRSFGCCEHRIERNDDQSGREQGDVQRRDGRMPIRRYGDAIPGFEAHSSEALLPSGHFVAQLKASPGFDDVAFG